ncbi:type II toxin-antitoxin system VapC family toxin [Microbispora sp. ATCC PTA-5024]|uniref:type II toxin-antitoxin system VapC family toxin n=1 Tax=Microbispora sp. ATCC PTA-5024 TaxID=316330 RepID=UPI0003DBC2CB|nr:type II toxin-antitoxin system VapC family toxin [Microbispora sp. ATCC PTA-5024]ETK33655.1 twitching motility protein PilT [Microbispora sp. ATCC PTA-5024]
MRILLDTHVVLWWLSDDPTLADETKSMIDEEPDVFVSPATLWEVAIKQSIGKLAAPDDLVERIRDSEFRELPVRFDHAIEAGRLPLLHRDPFDRLLVAQARCEGLSLVTRDGHIPKYDVPVITA